ncbi:MAG: hypothetical protein IIT54_01925 [Acetobacter sp.]|nr:hypothetical protein [Acetobacter sp.]
MKKQIQSVISEIYSELEKNKHKQNTLRKDKVRFNKCYSVKWVLEDISEAIEVYKNYARKEKELDLGTKYLMIYGVLQVLFLQQNALKDLCDALNYKQVDITKENNPKIYEIREIRNDIAGHPTTGRGSSKYTTYLSRHSCYYTNLSLRKIQYQETENDEFIDVDIISSIDTQEKFIKEQLEKILSKLRDETKEHIEKFKNDKLEDCFGDFTYARTHQDFYTQNDQMGFNLIKGIIEKLKEKLNKRCVDWEQTDFKDNIKSVEEIYTYLLSKPKIINETIHEADDKESFNENKFLKRNLLKHMFCMLDELKKHAKEVDTDYENNFETKFKGNQTPKKVWVTFDGKNGFQVT